VLHIGWLSFCIECTNGTNGCHFTFLFKVLGYNSLSVIYISDFLTPNYPAAGTIIFFMISPKFSVSFFLSSVTIALGLLHHLLNNECPMVHV
jgi:hypothetical protein